jgi:phosphate uptake regulator
MKRKVIKQGHDTLTVTLPHKWVDTVQLNPGDDVDIEESEGKLIISTAPMEKQVSKISLDLSGLDRAGIMLLMQGAYVFGYDDIELHADSQSVPHFRKEKEMHFAEVVYETVERFIGAEIISSQATYFEIKKISQETYSELATVMRRIFRLLNEMMGIFYEGAAKQDMKVLQSIEFSHITMKKFANYSLRLLNKFGYNQIKKTNSYFSIVQYLSKEDDLIKNAARFMVKHNFKLGKKAIAVVKEIENVILAYYDLFYNYKKSKISPIIHSRDTLRNEFYSKINSFSKEELVILASLMQINEIIIDLIELRAGLEKS